MHLQTLDRLSAAFRGPKLKRAVFRWVVLPRFCQLLDDMLDLCGELSTQRRLNTQMDVPGS